MIDIFKIGGTIALNGSDEANSAIDTLAQKGKNLATKVGNGLATVAKVTGAVISAAGTAIVAVGKVSLDAYADYEQFVGGVETLFKDSADIVQEYAANAYKTAGLSANEYMETVTSFSASLLQSLGNDTAAAAEMADLAITDMSDNANKMGTDMASIQNAYQGFAKQNYTMLDNLKLGYGGTKEEMQRLIDDANALNAAQGKLTEYSIDSFADIVSAIHDVQTEMGITGTTAKEASSTIQGSLSAAKSAWQNLLVGFADGDQDLDELINHFVSSVITAADNIVPRLTQIFGGLSSALEKIMPIIAEQLPGLIEQLIPGAISGAVALAIGLVQALPSILQILLEQAPFILTELGNALIDAFPVLVQAVEDLFWKIVEFTGLEDVVSYVSDTFSPVFESVITVIQKVKDAFQPLIDKFTDYVTSGEMAEDATNLFKDACQLLADVALVVVDAISAITDWCIEHQGTIETIAIIVGSFATAWGLVSAAIEMVNAAIEIWNVISVIATAGTTAFGVAVNFLTSPITLVTLAIGALIAIIVLCVKHWDEIKEAASKAWEWIKNAWQSAATWFDENVIQPIIGFFTGLWDGLKAVWDGICNVISIAVQLIASILDAAFQIITLPFRFIWENCKEYVFAAWEWIKEKVTTAINAVKAVINTVWTAIANFLSPILNGIKNTFSTIWNAITNAVSTAVNSVKNTVSTVFNSVKNTVSTVFNSVKNTVSTVFNSVKSTVSNIWNGIKTTISNVVNGIKTTISNTFNSVKNTVSTVFNSIKSAITTPIEKAKSTISGIVDKIKGLFSKMNISFPSIKLPHFSIKPDGWSIGDLLKGSIPSLGISWYAKGAVLDKPTIFGVNGNSLMAGGEAGKEAVAPISVLQSYIADAVASQNAGIAEGLNRIAVILDAIFDSMGDDLKEQISSSAIQVDNRVFGRLVRGVM